MTEKQKAFCKDFDELMKKYNISEMYISYDQTISFISNGYDLWVYGYDKKTGLQVIIYEKDKSNRGAE